MSQHASNGIAAIDFTNPDMVSAFMKRNVLVNRGLPAGFKMMADEVVTPSTTVTPEVPVVTPVVPVPPVVKETPTAAEPKTYSQEDYDKVKSDAASNRIKARDAKAEATKEAKDRIDAFLKTFDPDYKPEAEADPKVIAEQAATERDAQKRENAVLRNSMSLGVNADKLLNRMDFNREVATIDPADSKAVTELINKYVTDDPSLKVVGAATKSSGKPASQSGQPATGPTSLAQALAQGN